MGKDQKNVIVKKAVLADISGLIALWESFIVEGEKLEPVFEKLGLNAKQKLKMHLKKIVTSQNSVIFIAVFNQKIIGFIGGTIQQREPFYKQKKYGKLFDFMVQKEFRRKGIGKKLFQTLQFWFKKRKVKFIELSTLADNKKVQHTYQKMGFKSINLVFRKQL